MSKSSAKLRLPNLPSAPGASRRQQYSASTKNALVAAAEALFTAKGYAATSLDAIVADADVTKGALYHHFSGKQALFEAVFEDVESAAAQFIHKAVKGVSDPWEKSAAGLRAFLQVVQDSAYSRIVIQEGPSILGFERFREQEERSSYAIVEEIVNDILKAGQWTVDQSMARTFSRIFFGALTAAGETVSTSSSPAEVSEQVETALGFIISGLRSLVEAGVELPGTIQADGSTT